METKIFEDFELQEGKEKIMLSAPHAFIHLRDGEIRLAETNTNKIVLDLCDELKTYGIYKTISSDNDANYDKDCQYKKECLKQVKRSKIKLLIDFHGMASEREEDICIGIANYELVNNDKEFIDQVIKIFNKNGFKNVSIDKPFDCTRKECVSNYIHAETGIYAMQIEINGKYRLEDSKEFNLDGIKKSIKDIIKLFKNSQK
ncbi:MAG: N-formylglutamate amidohydrolase [archaeon]|nr:N-formylglutamate amidohydrolase [archaeon]